MSCCTAGACCAAGTCTNMEAMTWQAKASTILMARALRGAGGFWMASSRSASTSFRSSVMSVIHSLAVISAIRLLFLVRQAGLFAYPPVSIGDGACPPIPCDAGRGAVGLAPGGERTVHPLAWLLPLLLLFAVVTDKEPFMFRDKLVRVLIVPHEAPAGWQLGRGRGLGQELLILPHGAKEVRDGFGSRQVGKDQHILGGRQALFLGDKCRACVEHFLLGPAATFHVGSSWR